MEIAIIGLSVTVIFLLARLRIVEADISELQHP